MTPAALRELVDSQKEIGITQMVLTVPRGTRRPKGGSKRVLGQNAPIVGSTLTHFIVMLDVPKADKWLRERGV